MSKTFTYIINSFGYKDRSDFLQSAFHPNLVSFLIPITLISTMIERHLGLEVVSLLAFMSLLGLELITGISASAIKKQKIESKRLSRFFLKLFAWVNVLFVLSAFKWHYQNIGNLLLSGVYGWLHTATVIYVSFEYLISVLENISVISSKSNMPLIRIIKGSIDKLLNDRK